MADQDNKPSIFSKMLEAGHAMVDAQLHKAKTSIVMNQDNLEDEFYFGKTITEDPSYAINASGWKDKPYRLMDGHLKQMSLKNSVISAIIQTRQNQVANHSKLVKSEKERGWMLCLRDEDALLQKIKAELEAQGAADELGGKEMPEDGEEPGADQVELDPEESVAKAQGDSMASQDGSQDSEEAGDDLSGSDSTDGMDNTSGASQSDDEVEAYNWELERKAREKLESQFKKAKKRVQDFVINCGITDNRPFDTLRWDFDLALRAWVRDSLTYDRYTTEIVPDNAGRVHHWFPIDAGTIKFATLELSRYKEVAENFLNLDLLFPEKQAQQIEKQKILELKPELLAKNEYKYVQVIRGKIERAYTADELKLGVRNMTTDIYNNGYGVSELELVVGLVTGHLNAEFYNQAYFTQGFSAKGILHIKAALNRRKIETIRQQWQHMLKGSRNSFQTPIFAGMDDVEWIPLTQNHNDIGFEGWMRYLIKMICAIYQIDPAEIGIAFKDEGTGGQGMSGDNTKHKMEASKDKGLYPLLRHIENYVNEQIIKPFDSRFILRFTGITNETRMESLERQEKEVKFKKTVNEIRAEDGLPPLPGMDDVILETNYMSWYSQFSDKGQELQKKNAEAAAANPPGGAPPGGDENGKDENQDPDGFEFGDDSVMHPDNLENNVVAPEEDEPVVKSKKPRKVKVEYYTLKD
jgi:hypothetical protein